MTNETQLRNEPERICTRTALDQIVAVLEGCDPFIRRDVIAVLTALRGPDMINEEVKALTTGVIRTAAFGSLAREFGTATGGSMVYVPSRNRMRPDDQHFYTHVIGAAHALGLSICSKEKDDRDATLDGIPR